MWLGTNENYTSFMDLNVRYRIPQMNFLSEKGGFSDL